MRFHESVEYKHAQSLDVKIGIGQIEQLARIFQDNEHRIGFEEQRQFDQDRFLKLFIPLKNSQAYFFYKKSCTISFRF